MATRRELPERAAMLQRGEVEGATFKPVRIPSVKNPAELGRIRTQLTRNVARIYRDAPAATVQRGKEWYPRAHYAAAEVGRRLGADTSTGAGIIAALSPSMAWEDNIPAAHSLRSVSDHHMQAMAAANERQKAIGSEIDRHERAAARAQGQRGPNAKVKGAAPAHLYGQYTEAHAVHMRTREFLVGTPLNNQSTDNIIKAARIRSGERPEAVLPMQVKTGNFYRNVNDPSDPHPVTIDTHAHDAARMVKMPFETDRGLTGVRRYNVFSDAYRNAVPHLGAQFPHEVQAVVWQHWKNRYGRETSGGGHPLYGTLGWRG